MPIIKVDQKQLADYWIMTNCYSKFQRAILTCRYTNGLYRLWIGKQAINNKKDPMHIIRGETMYSLYIDRLDALGGDI